jgi:CDP-6-deoxy-D-xylo-4-hexulose-3-dehydrase
MRRGRVVHQYPTAFKNWGIEEIEAIERVISSDRFTQGPEVEAFEAEFAAYHGRSYAIMTNSGSSANLVATDAIVIRRGLQCSLFDVLVPAIAWSTTYGPIIQRGFYPILNDVDATWNADPGLHPSSLVVGCSILGCPARLDHPFLEDNCEALGARTETGQLTGTFGDLSTFSFFHSHQISAIEGGCILTDDLELARLCRVLANHGNEGFAFPTKDFDHSYRFTQFGFNVRGLEMHAAIAREQLKKLDHHNVARRSNLAHFTAATEGLPITLQAQRGTPAPFGLAFTVDGGNAARARLVAALQATGIDARLPTGGSFLRHPYGAPWRDQKTPNADRIHDTGLFLGNAPFPIPHLIEKAVGVMRHSLEVTSP